MAKPLDPTSPRARIAAAKRATIAVAAHDLFRAHGYEAVTMRTIAKAAGCSTGLLFNSWAGKDALFTEVMGRKPIDDARGVQYLAALFEIRRALRDGPDVEHAMGVLARLGLDDPVV